MELYFSVEHYKNGIVSYLLLRYHAIDQPFMRYCSFLLLVVFIACHSPEPAPPVDPYLHIQDLEARAILRSAIDHAGGLERWKSIKNLSYTKDFSLLHASGQIERDYRQTHHYQYDPVELSILSIENGDTVITVLSEGRYHRTVNDSLIQAEQAALEQAVNTSVYVVGIPFKLLDPGPGLHYIGTDTLEEFGVVDILEVNYANDPEESGSDIWRYYFDRPDRKVVANWVKTSDHFSLVENLSYTRAGGILFNQDRKSYRVDSLGNKLYLRADYHYDNFRVE